MKRLDKKKFQNAPRILLGAFFLCCSCEEKAIPEEPSAKNSEPVESPIPGNVIQKTPATPAKTKDTASETGEGIRFMAYNIENYLTMTRYVKGGGKVSSPKDPKEVAALVKIIVDENPISSEFVKLEPRGTFKTSKPDSKRQASICPITSILEASTRPVDLESFPPSLSPVITPSRNWFMKSMATNE